MSDCIATLSSQRASQAALDVFDSVDTHRRFPRAMASGREAAGYAPASRDSHYCFAF